MDNDFYKVNLYPLIYHFPELLSKVSYIKVKAFLEKAFNKMNVFVEIPWKIDKKVDIPYSEYILF